MTDPAKLYVDLVATFQQGRWEQAQALASQLLPFASEHAGVYSIAGVIKLELGQPSLAADYFRRAEELDPARADFATLHAKSLLLAGFPGGALQAADRALALSPDDPMTLDTLGVIYTQAHAHTRAITAFRKAVTRSPTLPSCRFNLANALVAAGDIAAAEHELRACTQLAPGYWNAHLLLSQLRRQSAEHNHLEPLHLLLSQHGSAPDAQIYLNMALAKEYEDLDDYPRAFKHLQRGKSAARKAHPYSIRRDQLLFEALMNTFRQPEPDAAGDPTDEPIFIIGMPRSGTTLVERIISNHPDVYAAGELQNFSAALQQTSDSPVPLLLDPAIALRTSRLDWKQLGARYLASTRPLTGQSPRFVDKLPHNFLYAGFIANALPNAKIICLRRNPLDTCLGNFRQLFESASFYFDYSHDLIDAGQYFVLFDRLMTHWQRVFPGRIFELQYEELVSSPEFFTQKLLDFCGLPWDQACLTFEANQAPVTTFSATQVREPIHRSAVGRWKKYAEQLQELRSVLAAAGIQTDD